MFLEDEENTRVEEVELEEVIDEPDEEGFLEEEETEEGFLEEEETIAELDVDEHGHVRPRRRRRFEDENEPED